MFKFIFIVEFRCSETACKREACARLRKPELLPAVLYLVRCLELALLLLCKLDCPNVVQTRHSVVFFL